MADLKAQATRRDPNGRLQWKLTLVKMLYQRGYTKEDILELFRFIDWLMVLPDDLELSFTEALREYEEETKMAYVTSIERRGLQQGLQEGLQQGLQEGLQQGLQQGLRQGLLQKSREAVIEILEARFEVVPQSIVEIINDVDDLSILKMLLKKAATVQALEDFSDAASASGFRS